MSPAEMHRPYKGLAAEHLVAAKLIQMHFPVFLPIRPMSSHADLVIEVDRKLFSVQVKSFPLTRKMLTRLLSNNYDVVATVDASAYVTFVAKDKLLSQRLKCKVHEFYG